MEGPEAVLEYIYSKGCANMYELAKALNISYGQVQWYVYKLAVSGVVKNVKVGRRRYVTPATAAQIPDCVKVEDVVEELDRWLRKRQKDQSLLARVRKALREAGVEDWGPLAAVKQKAPDIYTLLREILDHF
jgi:DNA-binding Lrp family transcriptional regulator